MTQTATNEDSVQFSLHELRRIEMERQAHEAELAEQQRLAEYDARLEAERAERERKESEKRRCLEVRRQRQERRAQYRARLEAEQSIAVETARVAVDARRVELEIKRVELEARQLRAVARPSVWRRLALVAMFAIMIGQALFIGATYQPQRAAAPVTPAEVAWAEAGDVQRHMQIPADSGDRVATNNSTATESSKPPARAPKTGHTSSHTSTTHTTTPTVPERFTLDGCDPNQPLCRN